MSLPIAWVFKNKPVLIVGGGEVASTRIEKLIPVEAKITVVAIEPSVYIQKLADEGQLELHKRKFEMSDLHKKWNMVLTAISDHELSSDIADYCRDKGIVVNVADVPKKCDFYFGANYTKNSLKLLVSTGSAAPRLARRVLNELAAFVDERNFDSAIKNVEVCRKMLRQLIPQTDPKAIEVRMRVMKAFCDKLSWDELSNLSELEIKAFVRGMTLSVSACPAHPVDIKNAEDFVEYDLADKGGTGASQIIEKQEENKTNAKKGHVKENSMRDGTSDESSESTAEFSSDSSSESGSDSGSDSNSDSDMSSSSNSNSNTSIATESNGKQAKRNKAKRTAIECVEGYPTPKKPPFPFHQ